MRATARGLLAGDFEIPPDSYADVEAIINEELRPAVDIVNGQFTVTHPLWRHLSTDAAKRGRLEAAIPAIGRVELAGSSMPYVGTGFVVGENLLMTNRHVAEVFTSGLGDRKLDFIPGSGEAGVSFVREFNNPGPSALTVDGTVLIHPYWDMALLRVSGLPAGLEPLKLALDDARDMVDREICVIGYPAYDPRNPADAQQQVYSGKYGIKRLQPGRLKGATRSASFGKYVDAAGHDASTLGGCSGAAVIDPDTGLVLALHFGGQYHKVNFGVPAGAMAQDARIVDQGVRFSGTPSRGPNTWGGWWTAADNAGGGGGEGAAAQPPPAPPPAPPAAAAPQGSPMQEITLEIPLQITIKVGQPRTPTGQAAATFGGEVTEAMRMPEHRTSYAGLKGYDTNFLGNDMPVPLPWAKDPKLIALTNSGKDILHYQNFSIVMHAKRRLALFTASNVTKEEALRKPDPNGVYGRAGLSGLGKNDQEMWFLDPRLDEKYQLPDVFYTKDNGAFDKGHIVRRDDAAWGKTYALLKAANGDTYHVTNCSPQVADFNRSNLGELNWGDLENHVLSSAASERLSQFAGPIMRKPDQTFVGVGKDKEVLRVQIPTQFWKVIVARTDDGLASFGFILDQDLQNTNLEFVSGKFAVLLRPLAEISKLTGVVFDETILKADQYDTERGTELVMAGVPRKQPNEQT